MAEIDFDTFAAERRAEAERQIQMMEKIVALSNATQSRRAEFIAEDERSVSELTSLLGDAAASGIDAKTIKQFRVEPLMNKPARTRASKPRTPKKSAATASQPTHVTASDVSDSSTSDAVSESE